MSIARSLSVVALALAGKAQDAWWHVSGRLVDRAGVPIAAAGFTFGGRDAVATVDALERPIARTRADGSFAFDVSCDRAHTRNPSVLVAAPGKAAVRFYVEQSSGHRVDVGEIRLPEGVTLKGRVRGARGQPLAHARVSAGDLITLRTWADEASADGRWLGTYGFTAADGSFALPGALPDCVRVLIVADGHGARPLQPVGARDPLIVQLEETGFLAGQVVDGDGKGVPDAWLDVTYETWSFLVGLHGIRADAEGRFKSGLRWPGRFQVSASRALARDGVRVQSEVLEGPQANLVLEVGGRVAAGPGPAELLVTAVDAAGGAAIPRFRAAVLWTASALEEADLLAGFAALARPSDDQGQLRIGPRPDRQRPRAVLVQAEGRAPLWLRDIPATGAGPLTLAARLRPESAMAGKVVDAATGAALPGAELECVHRAADRGLAPTVATSAADGSFRIGSLGAGQHWLWARLAGGRSSEPVAVTLTDEATIRDVVVPLMRGLTVSGKLAGGELPAGWRLQVVRAQAEQAEAPLPRIGPERGLVPIGADGTFQCEGLESGAYELVLLAPCPWREGPSLRVPLDRLLLGQTDLRRDLDLVGRAPRRIRGRVAATGVPLPQGRLAVVAPTNPMVWSNMGCKALAGRRCLVAADGSFELLVTGTPRLHVVDVATGLQLAQEAAAVAEIAGGPAPGRVIDVPLVPVRCQLVPQKGQRYAATRLTIEQPGTERAEIPGTPDGPSLDLPDSPQEVTFYLPPGVARLTVWSGANQLLTGMGAGGHQALAEAEVTAKLGEPIALKLPIADRPELPQAAAPNKAAAGPRPPAASQPAGQGR